MSQTGFSLCCSSYLSRRAPRDRTEVRCCGTCPVESSDEGPCLKAQPAEVPAQVCRGEGSHTSHHHPSELWHHRSSPNTMENPLWLGLTLSNQMCSAATAGLTLSLSQLRHRSALGQAPPALW